MGTYGFALTDLEEYDRAPRDDVVLLTRAFCETGTHVADWQVELALDQLAKILAAG